MCTHAGDEAEPVAAALAALSCRRWFSPEPYNHLGYMALIEAIRMVDQSDARLRYLTPMAMFELVTQALRSGHLVAYLGDVCERRTPSSNKTTSTPEVAPTPPSVPDPVPPPPREYTCRWRNCPGTHEEDINPHYPNDGVLARGKDSNQVAYADAWIAAGLEPWIECKSPGTDPQATRNDYQRDLVGNEVPKPQNLTMIDLAVSSPSGQYVTQKHHLISTHLFGKVPSLANNARLVGYNANNFANGICLPYFTLDIVRHDRQCHRGKHIVDYDNMVLPLLLNLEEEAESYCDSGIQKELIERLERISARARQQILGWKKGWYLRTRAETERADAYRRIGQDVPYA